jgi:hypothetical protein
MNPNSARALVWLSLILIIVGPITTAYSSQFAISALGALIVLPPAVFSSKRTQIAAAALLAIGLAVSIVNYPGYKAAMDRSIARSHERSLDLHGSSAAARQPGGDAQEQRASE